MIKRLMILAFASAMMMGCNGQSDKAVTEISTAKNVDVEEFASLVESGNGLLLDVRTVEEFDEAHLLGAKMLDFYSDTFESEIAELDKETPVYVYCRSGGRSGKAMGMMQKMGFKEVYNLSGGIIAWKKANKPTE